VHLAGIARNTNLSLSPSLSSQRRIKKDLKKNPKQKSATFRVVVKRDVIIHGKSFNLRAARTSASGITVASV